MHDGEQYSLLVPANAAVRLNSVLGFQSTAGTPQSRLLPSEVLERGIDFVRYAVDWQ